MNPLYIGEFKTNCLHGRVATPSIFNEADPYGFRGSPVVLLPFDEQVFLYNWKHYGRLISTMAMDRRTGESISAEEFKEMVKAGPASSGWTAWSVSAEELTKMVEANPAPPDCVDSRAYAKSRSALTLLKSKSLQDMSRLSSPDFKKFIGDSLAACGIDVQMRVRALGGEIDLLLATFGRGGMSFTIIQCRHRVASGREVGMDDVVRSHDLSETIKREFFVLNTITLSTTGFSPQAEEFAEAHGIEALDYPGFLEWVGRCGLESNEFARPSLMYTQVDTRGRLNLPECVAKYVGASDGEVTFVGNNDHLEIWNTELWEARLAEPMPSYGEMLAEAAGRVQPESDE